MGTLSITAATGNQFTLAYWGTTVIGEIEAAVNGIDKNNIATNYKIVEFASTMPAAGNAQRIICLTADDSPYTAWKLYVDNGAAWIPANNVLYASVYDNASECALSDILEAGTYGFRWGVQCKVSSGSEFLVSVGSIVINGKYRYVASTITCGVGNIQGGGAFAAGSYEVYALADTAATKTIDVDDIKITLTSADVTGTYTNYRLIGYVEYVGSAIQGVTNLSEVLGLSRYESVSQSLDTTNKVTYYHNLGTEFYNLEVWVRNTAAGGKWYRADQAVDSSADHWGISIYDSDADEVTIEMPDESDTAYWYGAKSQSITKLTGPCDVKVVAIA